MDRFSKAMIFIFIGAAAALAATHSMTRYPPIFVEDRVNPQFSDNDYQKAALDIIYPKLDNQRITSDDDLASYKAKIAELRQWASGIRDPRMQSAMMDWFDYYDNQAEQQLKRIKNSEPADDWQAKYDKKKARADALRKIVPIPAMPSDVTP